MRLGHISLLQNQPSSFLLQGVFVGGVDQIIRGDVHPFRHLEVVFVIHVVQHLVHQILLALELDIHLHMSAEYRVTLSYLTMILAAAIMHIYGTL